MMRKLQLSIRVLPPLAVLLATLALTVGLAQAGTCTTDVPMGALAPARPIWCDALVLGRDTHSPGSNSWADDFNHGQSMATLNSSYQQGFIGNGDALHFQHNDHWMVDIQSNGNGALIGAWMRPNRTFNLQSDGSVVIEFEVAGPIAGTREVDTLSDSWPELVLSTAAAPPGMQAWGSPIRKNGTYLYEGFPGFWTFGCRMQQSRHPICALYQNDLGVAGTKPSRRWEINQNGGEVLSQFGGDPTTPGLANVWKSCTSTQDPDTVCRNQFRWEIRANQVTLFANGVLYYQAVLIDSEMNNILQTPGGFYIYFGDFAYRMDPGRPIRFHWDHLAINPNLAGGPVPVPPAVPVPPGATNTPTPTPAPNAPATSTPTRTATPTATSTATATPPSAQQPDFQETVTVAPAQVLPGQTVNLTVSATSSTTLKALTDVEIFDRSGNRVFQRAFDQQSFVAGQPLQVTLPWEIPATLANGSYTVKVGIFSAGWGTLYDWEDNAARITVG